MHKKAESSAKRGRAHKKNRQLTILTSAVVFSMVAVFAGGAIYTFVILRNLPSPDQFGYRQVSESSKIYDRTGQVLLYEIHGEEKRTIVPFVEIPQKIKEAVLVAEDVNFYRQPAFDWKAIVRAFLRNIESGEFSQGGSTITQQLVKNVFLTSEKTLSRKIKELVLAVKLESKYSKDEILGFYLNQVPFGSNAYGVEAASQTYFGKSVKNLSLAESAIIASILKAPSYYSPWGNHTEDLMDRKDYVLDRLFEYGHISSDELEKAKKDGLKFAPPSIGTIKAPHFVLTVKDYLINRYGEYMVTNGGLKVITTLDWNLQQLAEKSVSEGVERNVELYGSKNGALVAQDPKTGQILAMVGSKDYFDVENEGNFNVAVQGLRQPGSALKPFVYMTAFQKGYSPRTVLYDVSTEFDTREDPEKSYRPQNFDNTVHGPVAMEQALAQSLNIPAVKTLYLAGFDDVLKNLHKFGITTLNERWRYGLSLTLGGGEVKLIDLVNAYATLSQEGVRHAQSLVLKTEDGRGSVLEEYSDNSERAIEQQYPRLVTQILSDPELRQPIFGGSLPLTVFQDHQMALKTGTSEDHRDAWTVGYTPSLVVGVWAGNNDNSPMIKKGSSILAAVPMWSAFLKSALKNYPSETFERPDPISLPNKPLLNGQADFVPVINGRSYPQLHEILYYADRSDPLGPPPETPEKDAQFKNWEIGLMDWARKNIPNFHEYNQPLPDRFDFSRPVTTITSAQTKITNIRPASGEFINSPFSIQAEISSNKPLGKIEVFFNGKLINSFSISTNFHRYYYYSNEPVQPQNSIEFRITNNDGEETSETAVVFH